MATTPSNAIPTSNINRHHDLPTPPTPPPPYSYSTSIVELNKKNSNNNNNNNKKNQSSPVLNPLIARGAFGHVDIALCVQWRRRQRSHHHSPENEKDPKVTATATSTATATTISNNNENGCHHSIISSSRTDNNNNNNNSIIHSVTLAAIKTIPNAIVIRNSSSGSAFASLRTTTTTTTSTTTVTSSNDNGPASLTREAFAELNALRLLQNNNGHINICPLLGYYGAANSDSSFGNGGGFGGWDWAGSTDDAASSSMAAASASSPSSLCLVFPYHPIDLAEALNYIRLNPSFPTSAAATKTTSSSTTTTTTTTAATTTSTTAPLSPPSSSSHSFPSDHYFPISPIVIQSIIHDILSALHHVHSHHLLHRDVKPGNLYITMNGRVQLGDFGLAKAVVPPPPSVLLQESSNVCVAKNNSEDDDDDGCCEEKGLCTLQYRPPELLLGGTGIITANSHGNTTTKRNDDNIIGGNNGGVAVADEEDDNSKDSGVNGAMDIWSAGCILVELLTLSGPIFPGQSVLDQLGRIFAVMGTPTEKNWPGATVLPDWNKVQFEPTRGTGLKERINKEHWSWAHELACSMLSLDPMKRPSAKHGLSFTSLWLKSFETTTCCSTTNDRAWEKKYVHQLVVHALVPPSLQVMDPIFFGDEQCMSDDDPLAYAKRYASKCASSRRSFPQSNTTTTGGLSKKQVSNDVPNERWTCKMKSNGLLNALRSM